MPDKEENIEREIEGEVIECESEGEGEEEEREITKSMEEETAELEEKDKKRGGNIWWIYVSGVICLIILLLLGILFCKLLQKYKRRKRSKIYKMKETDYPVHTITKHIQI